jgi:hypothetical protein
MLLVMWDFEALSAFSNEDLTQFKNGFNTRYASSLP